MDRIANLKGSILDLSNTIQEGLDHLNKRMAELPLEDTRYLFADIADAYQSIVSALEFSRADTKADYSFLNQFGKLPVAFAKMNQSYDENKLDEARMDMQFILLPAFKEWREELERYLTVLN